MDLPATLRAIREAVGLTQYDFAEWLLVSRKTVQRWEAGRAVPDARAEEALVEFCRERGAFGDGRGALAALLPDEGTLRTRFVAARTTTAPASEAPAGAPAPGATMASGTWTGAGAGVDLIGRDDALVGLVHQLTQRRLVTVTGIGGVGKTALAAAAADRWADGPVHRVLLAPVVDAATVGPTIARAVGARQGPGTSLRESIVAAVEDPGTLLFLDNLEHLPRAAPLVADLVASCPGLTILITSRSPLRLTGEQEYPLSPLAVPDLTGDPTLDDLAACPAVQLFVSRARAAEPSFSLTLGSAGAVAEVCAALDGLPLALELAAARVRLLPPVVLRDRLAERFRLLRTTAPGVPGRHRTLAAVLDWSHDLLTPPEQVALRRLAVFAGAFSVEAAEAVVADGAVLDRAAVIDAVSGLVDQHLVQPVDGGVRHCLLETVRSYAAERLEAAGTGEDAALRDRHAQHVLSVATAAAPLLRGADQAVTLASLRAERADLDAALEHLLTGGGAETALRLAVALAGLWDAGSELTEGRAWLDRVLAAAPEPSPWRAAGLVWAAYFAALQLDLSTARVHAAEALALGDRFGSDATRGYALMVLGGAAVEGGDDGEGARCYEDSLAALRAAGDEWGAVRPVNSLAEIARSTGDLDRAAALHEEALRTCASLGDRHSQVMVLCGIGQVHRLAASVGRARAVAEEALSLSRVLDNGVGAATALELWAAIAAGEGRFEDAASAWGAADRLRRRTGSAVEIRDRADQERAREATAAALGYERYAALLDAGGVLGWEALPGLDEAARRAGW